jgi:hypothetical protein
MNPVLYAAWLSPSADGTDNPRGGRFVEALKAVGGVGDTGLYRVTAGGDALKQLSGRLNRIDNSALSEGHPAEFVLAELESLDVAVDVGHAFGASSGEPAPEYGLLEQILLYQISYVSGPADVAGGGLSPAVQFGVFNVKEVVNEWQLHENYERHRLKAVASVDGQVRTRRYISVAGFAKYGILYEYQSLEARNGASEKSVAAQALATKSASALLEYQVMAPGSPFVGVRVV